MRKRSRTAAKLAGAVGVLALVATMLGLSPASAEEQPLEYVLLDGSVVTVGETEFPLFDPANPTSAGVTGVIDDVTGDFEGDLVIPPRETTQRVDAPVIGPSTINLRVSVEAEPIVGNVDPETGEVIATSVIDVKMLFVDLIPDSGIPANLALNIECTMADITMELASDPDGEPFDPETQTFAVAGGGFEFPLPECVNLTEEGAPLVPTVRDGLIENLGLPNSDTTAFLSFEAGTLTPPEPLPDPVTPTTAAPATPTTVAPATQPAQAVRTQPRVTG